MMTSTNTDRVAELESELLETELTTEQEKRASAFFGSLTCATTAAFALEMWLRRECEDETGADLVKDLVRKMAKHEAATM